MVLGYLPKLCCPAGGEEVSILYNRIALDITLSQMKIVCVYDGSQFEKRNFVKYTYKTLEKYEHRNFDHDFLVLLEILSFIHSFNNCFPIL